MFDREMRRRDLHFVRYGDDIAIFSATQPEAETALQAATRVLEKMHLPINREKSKLHHVVKGFPYLGEWLMWKKWREKRVRGWGEREKG